MPVLAWLARTTDELRVDKACLIKDLGARRGGSVPKPAIEPKAIEMPGRAGGLEEIVMYGWCLSPHQATVPGDGR